MRQWTEYETNLSSYSACITNFYRHAYFNKKIVRLLSIKFTFWSNFEMSSERNERLNRVWRARAISCKVALQNGVHELGKISNEINPRPRKWLSQ